MTTTTSFPPGTTYGMTTVSGIAHANDYIGERLLTINKVVNGICMALRGYYVPPTVMYYFGKPDDRLKQLFGYEETKPSGGNNAAKS